MSDSQLAHSTFQSKCRLKAAPARVWAAFADSSQLRRWYADSRPQPAEEFLSDCRPGGEERLQFRLGDDTPFPGMPILNQGHYLDVVENERIVSASTMSLGGQKIYASLLTVEFSPTVEGGTELRLTHQGVFFPGADGPVMREEGWKKLLDLMQASLEN